MDRGGADLRQQDRCRALMHAAGAGTSPAGALSHNQPCLKLSPAWVSSNAPLRRSSVCARVFLVQVLTKPWCQGFPASCG